MEDGYTDRRRFAIKLVTALVSLSGYLYSLKSENLGKKVWGRLE